MEISNSNAIAVALKNAAKNSPDIKDDIHNKKNKHHKDSTLELIESKKIGLNDISPSVVYHGGDESHPEIDRNIDISEMKLLRYKNFHESDSVREKRISERNSMRPKLASLQDEMKPLYKDFKQQVTSVFPDLADKEYGITVDGEGELAIINKGNLNVSQQDILNGFLNRFNGSSAFKQLANEHVEATVNWIELDRKPDNTGEWIGKFDVSKENYHKVIDLASIFKEDETGMDYSLKNSVMNQVFSKAELSDYTHQVDEYVNGEWISVEI